jgi:hypothetical protein
LQFDEGNNPVLNAVPLEAILDVPLFLVIAKCPQIAEKKEDILMLFTL